MKIAVACKWAQDPQDATVHEDGLLDWSRSPFAISEYDPIAIELGRRLASSTGYELIGISVGGPEAAAPAATKAVLARGVDKAVVVSDEAFHGAGPAVTGLVLAEVISRLGDVALLITGDSSIDNNAHLVPAVAAGHLGWNCLNAVAEVTITPDGAQVTRRWGAGLQTVRAELPLVLATSTDALEPPAPGMKDMLAARSKPVEMLSRADLALDDLLPTTRVLETSVPARRDRRRRLVTGADPAAAAQEILAEITRTLTKGTEAVAS